MVTGYRLQYHSFAHWGPNAATPRCSRWSTPAESSSCWQILQRDTQIYTWLWYVLIISCVMIKPGKSRGASQISIISNHIPMIYPSNAHLAPLLTLLQLLLGAEWQLGGPRRFGLSGAPRVRSHQRHIWCYMMLYVWCYIIYIYISLSILLVLLFFIFICFIIIILLLSSLLSLLLSLLLPVVPHKAVAEVSKIGNL